MIQLYNTMSRKKEVFKPITPGKVKMYVCGVTVYDYCHLGHARALITFDLIYRHLLYRGFDVTFVRNFTDIDDKIINRANEQNISWTELTAKFIQAFNEDTGALGLKKPTHEPKATEHMKGIVDIIKKLEERGLAYKADSDVYYAVRKFSEYGKLSGKNIEELESGARVDVLEAKHDPLDFALWKGVKPGEPSWPSPWGEGRPGWHIECSAMSTHFLGETFDIHGGGRDLIFPHHENEIAQSEGSGKKPFARYWLHNGFVNINAEKMSKSLGNFMTIRDILKQLPAEVIRLFILSAHYRSPLDYTDQNIFDARASLERYYQTAKRLEDYITEGKVKNPVSLTKEISKFKNDFAEAMDDDFNSAKTVGQIFEWVRLLNKAMDEQTITIDDAKLFFDVIKEIHQVFGIFGTKPRDFLDELKCKGLQESGVSESQILAFIEERKAARKNKDFAKSDEIRDHLAQKGVQLKDNSDGTTSWTVIKS